MAVVTLNRKSFGPTVSRNGIVLVDCWADWCGACKTFAPVYETVSANHPNHTFGKLNSETEREVITSLGVEQIPTLLLYRDGVLLFQQPGSYDELQLEEIVRQAESIDMQKVREQIGAEESDRSVESD
jgi:thioredoxin 1